MSLSVILGLSFIVDPFDILGLPNILRLIIGLDLIKWLTGFY